MKKFGIIGSKGRMGQALSKALAEMGPYPCGRRG